MRIAQLIIFYFFFHSLLIAADPQFSPTPIQVPLYHGLDGRGYHPEFADLDADGDLDVIYLSNNSSGHRILRYFRNDGTDMDPLFVEDQSMFSFLYPHQLISQARFFDYDQDGDLDLGIMEFYNQNEQAVVYQNIGTIQAPQWSTVPDIIFADASNLSEFFMRDVIGDSSPEVITAEYFDYSSDFKIHLFSWQADSLVEIPGYFSRTDSTDFSYYLFVKAYNIYFFSLPADSNSYLMINYFKQLFIGPGGMDWEFVIYKNIGTNTLPLWQPVCRHPDLGRPIQYPDPLSPVACYYEIFSDFALYYRQMVVDSANLQLEEPQFWMRGSDSYFTDVSDFDWKRNGLPDLVFHNNTFIPDPSTTFSVGVDYFMCIPDFYLDTTLVNYNQDPTFPLSYFWSNDSRSYFDFADLDNDGDSDFVLFQGSQYRIFRNTRSDSMPFWAPGSYFYPNMVFGYGLALNDFDGDGDFDMVVGYWNNSTHYSLGFMENLGTPSFPDFADQPVFIMNLIRAHPDFADLDGDGDLDMVVKHGYQNQEKLSYYRNESSDSLFVFTEVNSVLPNSLPPGAPHLMDADGDGDADLFVLEENGNLYYLENISPLKIKQPASLYISDFQLQQNYPNPFNSRTIINYQLPAAGEVELTIYNLLGQKVRSLVNGQESAGAHRVTWDGRDDRGREVASGVYVYRLFAGERFVRSRKMLLLR